MTVDLGKGASLPGPNDLPDGASPLDPDEAEGLLPDHISSLRDADGEDYSALMRFVRS
jgi:hypothetical protein